ncbi:MAG: response regulator [Acidobacteriota bacterium]
MKVLIVDDNPHEARLLRQAMETVAMVEFTHIAEGSEAIALLSSMEPSRFDLILLDWKLLGIQGDQLAKVYLSRPDRDPRIPLVFTSSAIPPDIQFQLQQLGCTVLTKPMDLEGYDEMAIRLTAICAEARRLSV